MAIIVQYKWLFCKEPLREKLRGGSRLGYTTFFREASKEDSKIGWKDIFSESFVKHSRQDREYAMQAGTVVRQVPEHQMLRTWRKPWLWWPLAKAGLALIGLLYLSEYVMMTFLGGSVQTLAHMCILIPPLIVPLIMMIFFWELNIPQNISLGDMAAFYMVGGVISFVGTTVMFELVPSGHPASYASLREEPGKLLATVLILLYIQNKQKKKIYGLTGLVVGAAVGAAFSGLESMTYALNIVNAGGSFQAVINNQLMRGLFAIAGHVAYCVPYSCAIALNADNGKLTAKSFLNMQFAASLAVSIGMHWLWNSGYSLLLNLALCCVAPFRLIYWVRKCLTQIMRICGPWRHQSVAAFTGEICLMCKTTALEGTCQKSSSEPLIIGRQRESCSLCFPANTPGVSREHCRVFLSGRGWMVEDLGSSYGTYVDGKRLAPHETAPICPGSNLYLGSRQAWITVL